MQKVTLKLISLLFDDSHSWKDKGITHCKYLVALVAMTTKTQFNWVSHVLRFISLSTRAFTTMTTLVETFESWLHCMPLMRVCRSDGNCAPEWCLCVCQFVCVHVCVCVLVACVPGTCRRSRGAVSLHKHRCGTATRRHYRFPSVCVRLQSTKQRNMREPVV